MGDGRAPRRAVAGLALLPPVFLLAACSSFPAGNDGWLEPALAVPAGYELTKERGPDFDVWHLVPANEADGHGLGLYIGHHPRRIEPVTPAKRMKGAVAGRPNVWLLWSEEGVIRQETQLTIRRGRGASPLKLHVWVWGETEEQVARMVQLAHELELVAGQAGAMGDVAVTTPSG